MDKIIASYDDTSGHFGVKKTLSKIKTKYFWVETAQDIENWTLSCQVCKQRKQPISKMRAPLQSIETRPLEVVGTDIVKFTKSKSGNCYGLVMVDLFTKYLNIYPLKDQTDCKDDMHGIFRASMFASMEHLNSFIVIKVKT